MSSVALSGFAPPAPLRHAISCPGIFNCTATLPARRRPRAPSAAAAAIRAIVTIRHATQADAEAAADCMARAFRGEEKYRDPITRWLVTRVSRLDMTNQLMRRLSGTGFLPAGDQNAGGGSSNGEEVKREHLLLVAEDDEIAEGIIGCVEMGVVNVPRLFTKGMLDEIDQWGERADAQAVAKLASHAPTAASESTSVSVAGDAGTADDDSSLESASDTPRTRASENSSRGRESQSVDLPYIGNVAVDARARRRGLARKLMAAAEDEAVRWGFNRVVLHVDAACVPAMKLYAALGYDCSAREPEWHPRVGRIRRFFLGRAVGPRAGPPVPKNAKDWFTADVKTVGAKLSKFEYLRLCFSGLKYKNVRPKRRE